MVISSDETGYVICPPLSDYPQPPRDQPGCELEKCPHCSEKMWISAKKRNLRNDKIISPENIYCYTCMYKKAEKDPSFLIGSERRNI